MPAAVVNSEDTQKSAADVSKKESTGTVSDENADNKDTQQGLEFQFCLSHRVQIFAMEVVRAVMNLNKN